jgi:3-hydroxyisobutyrate dehydrogenase
MKIGFIGLGNVGAKLADSLLRNGFELTVRDLNDALVQSFVDRGATSAASPKEMTERVDLIITCLPSPTVCSAVMESKEGIIAGLSAGKIWLEMSTTDQSEVIRLAKLVAAKGAMAMDCPVSGGCHRAATGNISIFAGGERETFERVLPILTSYGASHPAYRPNRFGIRFKSGHQLPLHRAPCCTG